MPRRNLLLLFGVALVSLVCYQTADRNPLGRYFSEVVDHIETRYVDEVDRNQLWNGAVKGMIGELGDPYSHFSGPEEAARFDEQIDQQFGGIGIQVAPDPKTQRLTVISPIVGSPAYRAGILAGDMIAKIDGASTQGMTIQEASRRMRGLPGEPVQLTIQRPGRRDPIDLPIIQREIIKIDSVLGDTRQADDQWNYLLDGDQKIGYVRIVNFGERTVDELRAALEELQAQGMKGLILDLRTNPGGLLTAAIGVCELFLPEGKTIVSVSGRDKLLETRSFSAGDGEKFLDLPLAVLVNGGSASASEIVAACLQDHHRAVVVGEQSYGKGTVQNVISLHGKRGNLTLTTADYLRPSGKNIHRRADAKETDQWGVTPDAGFEVKMTDKDWEKWVHWRSDRDIVRSRNGDKTDLKVDVEKSEAHNAKEAADDDRWKEDPPLRRAVEYIESQVEKRDGKGAATT